MKPLVTHRSILQLLTLGAWIASSARAQDPLFTRYGAAPGLELGRSVRDAGDINGDGRSDVIVGAPGAMNPSGQATGAAYVFTSNQSLLYSFFGGTGLGGSDGLGFSVSGAGDVNGDGRADVIVGSPNDDSGPFNGNGSATVYSGMTGAVLFTVSGTASGVNLGISVRAAGDVNRDGYADVIVGTDASNGLNGAAHLYAGPSGAQITAFIGTPLSGFGRAVSGAGDVDGDLVPDLIVGAPSDGAGMARVISGRTFGTLYEFFGVLPADRFGESVASAGDVNGDGRADMIVGAQYGGLPAAGNARVFSGLDGSELYVLSGSALGDQFGTSVSGVGDLDADGRPDLIVGAPQQDPMWGPGTGYARVYSGSTGALLFSLRPAPLGSAFGASVSGTADTSGDGFPDLIVGAPKLSTFSVGAGAVWLYSPAPRYESFCFGDGSGTACPCAAGAVGRGCPNSVEPSGGQLCPSGVASISADGLFLAGSAMPLSTVLYFQGTQRLNDGAGSVFGDGLVCVGGSIVRLGTKLNMGGGATLSCSPTPCAGACGGSGYPDVGNPPISVRGGITVPGTVRHYQGYYRNAAAFCTPATFNYTNAVTVAWGP